MDKTLLTTIPFSGFYNTIHDSLIDQALEQSLSGDHGDPISQRISDDIWAYFNAPMEQYTRAYVAAWVAMLNIEAGISIALKWESVQSPREYNFTTDRIFATVTEADARTLLAHIDRSILDKVCRDSFTSRSGFISHYDPLVDSWGDISTWDHNQIGTLLEAVVVQFLDGDWELALVADFNGNGHLDNWIYDAMDPEGRALMDLARELRSDEYYIPALLAGLRSELERIESEIAVLETEGVEGSSSALVDSMNKRELIALEYRCDKLTAALKQVERALLEATGATTAAIVNSGAKPEKGGAVQVKDFDAIRGEWYLVTKMNRSSVDVFIPHERYQGSGFYRRFKVESVSKMATAAEVKAGDIFPGVDIFALERTAAEVTRKKYEERQRRQAEYYGKTRAGVTA